MKKIHIFSLSYLAIGIILFALLNWISPKDFLGRYQSLEMMREMTDSYNDVETLIATVEASDRYLDFFINEAGEMNIVTIDYENTLFSKRYKSSHSSSTALALRIDSCKKYFAQHGTLYYSEVRTLISDYNTVRWSVLPADYKYINEDAQMHQFSFDNNEYILYIVCIAN